MKKVRKLMLKWGSTIAALALIVATYSAGTTCLFTAYQPRIPDALKK